MDLYGTGSTDIVAVSGFNEWKDPKAESLVVFKNDGHQNFTKHVLAQVPTHLITVYAADLDGTGHPVLITGRVLRLRPVGEHEPGQPLAQDLGLEVGPTRAGSQSAPGIG